MALRLIEAPEAWPVSLADVKAHAGISGSADDALLETFIKAATAEAENKTRRQLCVASWDMILDAFPIYTQANPLAAIELPRPPLVDVESITYTDPDGVEQTMLSGAYVVDADSFVGRVYPAVGTSWPDTLDAPGAVTVRYSCGWAMTDATSPESWTGPDALKTWILMRVAGLYGLRENYVIGQTVAEVPRSHVDCLLDPYIVPEVA